VNRRTRKGSPLPSLLPRRVVGVLTALLLAVAGMVGFASPAQAEDGYRYWNYFHLENDAWAFSQVGAADHQPEDGDVEGFRFGTSTQSQSIEPRADLGEVAFDTACSDVQAAEGQKRIAVVLDYGTDEGVGNPPAPRAECAVVDEGASTQDVLGEIAQVRAEGGMVCAIDGYPPTGCGEPVPDAEVAADEEPVSFALPTSGDEDEDAGTTDAAGDGAAEGTNMLPILVVAVVVVLLAVGAFLLARRRKAT
jgi:hypothetical protein